jgi:hypothetical protein
MKKTGSILVIVGMLVASLLLLSTALTPQVAASSERITTQPACDAVGGAGPCPGGLLYCCPNVNGSPVCGCWFASQCYGQA